MDCSLPGSSVHGILQAGILEWVASHFSKDLSNPGIESRSPALQPDSLPSEPPGKPKNYELSFIWGPYWGLYKPVSDSLSDNLGNCCEEVREETGCVGEFFVCFSLVGKTITCSWTSKDYCWWHQKSQVDYFSFFSVYVSVSHQSRSVMSDSLWPRGLYSPWNFLVQNTGVGSCSLLQGIFPTQGSNPDFPHCRQILYQLSYREAQEYWSG